MYFIKIDVIYKTRFYPDSGNYTCNCPGTWRAKDRKCKHIIKLQNEKLNCTLDTKEFSRAKEMGYKNLFAPLVFCTSFIKSMYEF